MTQTMRRLLAALAVAFLLSFILQVHAQDRPKRPGKADDQIAEGVELTRDVEYAKADETKLLLDIYLPKDIKEPLPLIVWIHGGGWRAGDKFPCPAARMVQRGYVVASVNYRLTDKASWPAQIHDCKAAVRFLRANAEKYHIDPKRVGAWGSSAGGHLVAMLGTSGDVKEIEGDLGNPEQSSRVQAVCDFFGPTDFTVMPDGGHGVEMVAKLLGGPLSENKDKAAQASPVTHVTKDDPPFLMMHGDKDALVPLNQSEILEKALKAAGVEAKLVVVKGSGHGFKGGADIDPVVDEFFDKHLKNDAGKPEYFDVGETAVMLPKDETGKTMWKVNVGVQLVLKSDDKLAETKDALTKVKEKLLDKIQMLLLKETWPEIMTAESRERLRGAIKAEADKMLGDPERVAKVVFSRYLDQFDPEEKKDGK